MNATPDPAVAKMMALARSRPLDALTGALVLLDAKPDLDPAERLTRSVLMDVICEKSPAANAALDAWADSDAPALDAVPMMVAAIAAGGAA
jgi:hypothetical protein